MRRLAAACAALGLLGAAGDAGGQTTPRLYVSLPLSGEAPATMRGMVDAMEFAIEESGVAMQLVVLDDATKASGTWQAAKVAANARRAAGDEAAVGYLGEFNSGASAISIPILNEAGLLQVSPTNSYVGLTRDEAAEPGEPDKYYPSGTRTFGRVAAPDHLQAAAIAKVVAGDGARRLFLIDDKELYGDGIADMVRRRTDVRVVGRAAVDPRARGYRGLARSVRRARADAVVFGGISRPSVARLWRDLHRAVPRARLYGAEGVADNSFTLRIPKATRKRTRIMQSTVAPIAWLRVTQRLAFRYAERDSVSLGIYDPAAYEAARVILDAYAAGAHDRASLVDAFFRVKDRHSVLGRYSIDANGDPTSGRFGLYGVSRGGRLEFRRAVTVP